MLEKPSQIDPDHLAYEQLASDPQWLKEYMGQVVVIVLGEFAGAYATMQLAIEGTREKYPNNGAFLQEVGNNLEINEGHLVPEKE